MQTAEVVLLNKSGLHARPAALFCRLALKQPATVQLENLTRGVGPVDGKRMLSVLTLGVEAGHRLRISVDGPDEEAVMAELLEAIHAGLGEAEADSPGVAQGR